MLEPESHNQGQPVHHVRRHSSIGTRERMPAPRSMADGRPRAPYAMRAREGAGVPAPTPSREPQNTHSRQGLSTAYKFHAIAPRLPVPGNDRQLSNHRPTEFPIGTSSSTESHWIQTATSRTGEQPQPFISLPLLTFGHEWTDPVLKDNREEGHGGGIPPP